MPKPNPFEGSNSSPQKYSIDELQQKYFYLTKIHGAALWDTSDGKELSESFPSEKISSSSKRVRIYTFAAPRTLWIDVLGILMLIKSQLW